MPTIHSVFEIARKTIQAKKLILLIALVLLLVVSVFVGSSIYKRNYFSHIVSQMLLQYPFADNGVAQDGSYLEIDTNPNNADPDSFSYNSRKASDSLDGIKFVNEKLGFSNSVYRKMVSTTALMGRQTAENKHFRVSWTYHPSNGLEVMYERK